MTVEEFSKLMESKKKEVTIARGTGPASLLAIAFIVLKLTGVISWSWWWVLAPIWIPIGIALLLILAAFIIVLIAASKDKSGINISTENKKTPARRSTKKKKADE